MRKLDFITAAYTGVGKSGFTVVHTEKYKIWNNNTRINSVSCPHNCKPYFCPPLDIASCSSRDRLHSKMKLHSLWRKYPSAKFPSQNNHSVSVSHSLKRQQRSVKQSAARSAHNPRVHTALFLEMTILLWGGQKCFMKGFHFFTPNVKKAHSQRSRCNKVSNFSASSETLFSECGSLSPCDSLAVQTYFMGSVSAHLW